MTQQELKYWIIQVAAFHWKVAPDYLVKKTQVRPVRRGLYPATPCHHSSVRGKWTAWASPTKLLLSWWPIGVAENNALSLRFLLHFQVQCDCIRPWRAIRRAPTFCPKILLQRLPTKRWLMNREPWTIAADEINDGDEHATTCARSRVNLSDEYNMHASFTANLCAGINDIVAIDGLWLCITIYHIYLQGRCLKIFSRT